MSVTSENRQRLDLLDELLEVLPKERKDKVMLLVMDIADSAYHAGVEKGSKRDLYAGPDLPSINIYPGRK
jgi:hypothetical protein